VSREFAVLDLKPGKARSESDTLDALKALLMGQRGQWGERLGRFMP
jgi:hypothetical protein